MTEQLGTAQHVFYIHTYIQIQEYLLKIKKPISVTYLIYSYFKIIYAILIFIYVYTLYMYLYMYSDVCVYIYVHIYIYIYTFMLIERER